MIKVPAEYGSLSSKGDGHRDISYEKLCGRVLLESALRLGDGRYRG